MSLEGLHAILNKEEVVPTRQARDLVERPQDVDGRYIGHVRTYIPMHNRTTADGQLGVDEFIQKLTRLVRDQKAPRGYITADFGYGKTSTGLYVWQQLSDAGFVTVPPFKLTELSDFLTAVYGWTIYKLQQVAPRLCEDAQHIYMNYVRQDIATIATRYGIDLSSAEAMLRDGILNSSLAPGSVVRYFADMTELVEQAGFEGLVVIADEVQQYLEPEIKSGKSDPVAPLLMDR